MNKTIYLIIFLNLFSLNSRSQYIKLYDLDSSSGQFPTGSFISIGSNLYGSTGSGGAHGKGNIFKINKDGSGFSKLMDFDGIASGSAPCGSLLFDGTFLYGMTTFGGIYDRGTIFKLKPDGSEFKKLMDFNELVTGPGSMPYGSLISDSISLYGTTAFGGKNYHGTIFRIDKNGNGFSKLLDCSDSTGEGPFGSLVTDGQFLYGMTNGGGLNGYGAIFKIKKNGTGFLRMFDFTMLGGSAPLGSLMLDGTSLFGMTHNGGQNNGVGIIFKLNTDGTNYSTLFIFQDSVSGSNPYGSLATDGSYLYGMTHGGGKNKNGTLFKVKYNGSGFQTLVDFKYILTGFEPKGSPYYDGTSIYGMTTAGGAYGGGTIFKYDLITGLKDDWNLNEVRLYPNPNNGKFSVKIEPHQETDFRLEIYSANGQQVLEDSQFNFISAKQIDISNSPKGIYFMMISNGNERYKQTFLIN